MRNASQGRHKGHRAACVSPLPFAGTVQVQGPGNMLEASDNRSSGDEWRLRITRDASEQRSSGDERRLRRRSQLFGTGADPDSCDHPSSPMGPIFSTEPSAPSSSPVSDAENEEGHVAPRKKARSRRRKHLAETVEVDSCPPSPHAPGVTPAATPAGGHRRTLKRYSSAARRHPVAQAKRASADSG